MHKRGAGTQNGERKTQNGVYINPIGYKLIITLVVYKPVAEREINNVQLRGGALEGS